MLSDDVRSALKIMINNPDYYPPEHIRKLLTDWLKSLPESDPITPEALQREGFRQTLQEPSDPDSGLRWDKRIGAIEDKPAFWVTASEDGNGYMHVHVTEAWGSEEDEMQFVKMRGVRTLPQLRALVSMLSGGDE